MHVVDETVHHLVHHVYEARLDISFDVAGYSLLVYDYLLTLGDETALIWPTPFNMGKILFLLVRYIPFIDGILLLYEHLAPMSATLQSCTGVFRAYSILIIMVMMLSEVIILFRTCVLIRRERHGHYIICILCFFSLCVLAVCIVATYPEFQPSTGDMPPTRYRMIFSNCAPYSVFSRNQITIFQDFIALACHETILVAFMLYKCLKLRKYYHSALISTLLVDGVVYYIYLLIVSIINICFIKILHAPGRLILFQQMLHSIFTTRVLMNLRMAVQRERERNLQCSTVSSRETSGYLSSVIIGVETWFHDDDDPADSNEGLPDQVTVGSVSVE